MRPALARDVRRVGAEIEDRLALAGDEQALWHQHALQMVVCAVLPPHAPAALPTPHVRGVALAESCARAVEIVL
eukprot:1993945-Rhodomonas_salina.4